MRAAAARLTGGVSPHAFIEAWGDWALHISRAPGRQLELVERAQRNAARLISQAMAADSETAPAFVPKAYDHRFDHPGWQKLPFQMWQQGFLAIWQQSNAEHEYEQKYTHCDGQTNPGKVEHTQPRQTDHIHQQSIDHQIGAGTDERTGTAGDTCITKWN